MQQLQAAGIGLVAVGVILTVGISILSTLNSSLEVTEQVTGESDINNTALPDTYNLDASDDPSFKRVQEGSVTVQFKDASAGTTATLTQGTDFDVNRQTGEIGIKDTETFLDLDSSQDEFITDYTVVNTDETASTGANDSISGITELSTFLPILGLVTAAVVVIGLVSGSIGKQTRGMA